MASNSGGRGGSNQGPNSFITAPTWQQIWQPNNATLPPNHGQINQPQTAAITPRVFDASTGLTPPDFAEARASNATYWNAVGSLETAATNTARIEFDPATLAIRGLLVEGSATNNVSQSNNFPDSVWGKQQVVLTTGQAGPGSAGSNATFFKEDGTTAVHGMYQALSLTAPATFSIYAKASTRRYLVLAAGTGQRVGFDVQTGSVLSSIDSGVSATATSVGNGWYRLTCSTSTNIPDFVVISLATTSTPNSSWDQYGETSYAGDNSSGMWIAFEDLRQTSTLTDSTIVTGASTATRAADSISFTLAASATALTFTFDDLSTQTVSGLTGGSTYTIPTTLNRRWILYIDDNTVAGVSGVGASAGDNTATAIGQAIFNSVGSSAGSNTTTAVGQAAFNAVGSSAGSNTATATATWLQSGIGSSAGSNTATATGQAIFNAVGSSAGSNTATATAAPIQAKVGSATGSNTATAVGAWLQSGVGSSAGNNTATAVGQAAFNAVGSAAGSNTATATAAWLQAGVGSAVGSNISAATASWLQSGAGSSAGSNAASATGAKLQSGAGSATGTNTATGTGAWLYSGVGASVGTNTTTGTGAWLFSGIGASVGSNTTTGIGHWLQSGVGNAQGDNTSSGYSPGVTNVGSATGTNTATGIGHWLQSGAGSATGSNVTAAIGAWLQKGVGSSAGSNTATAVGSTGAIVTGAGSAVGDNIATAIGAWLQTATGTAIGGSVVQGVGPSGDFNNDFSQDFSGFPGHETGFGPGDFNNDFNDDFAVFHVGVVFKAVGFSAGGNIATAVSTTEVFIPPVYPPVVIPVKVWHPAQEYHRVQAPRAIRTHRHGTELRRRPPQGMKRRYG